MIKILKRVSLFLGVMGELMSVEIKESVCRIDGETFPKIGYGTYPLTGKECLVAVEEAVKAGYRIIDTATFYQNFEPIGKALKKLERDKFYLISKVWPDSQAPKDLEKDLNVTLKLLQMDHIDAYLLHWPNSKISIEDTLHAMKKLKDQGKIRHIGLSNVTVNHLKRVLEIGVPITWVQIEMSPFFYDPELIKFCHRHKIAVQAWSPLGRGGSKDDPDLLAIAKKHGKTPSQVALRWIIQHDCIPLPATRNPQHMAENLDVFDFTLSEKEMAAIDIKAKGGERLRIAIDEFDFTYDQCWPKVIR